MLINFRIKRHGLWSLSDLVKLLSHPLTNWLALGKALRFSKLISFFDNVHKIFTSQDHCENQIDNIYDTFCKVDFTQSCKYDFFGKP